MILSHSPKTIALHVEIQIKNLLNANCKIKKYISDALAAVEINFSSSNNKYYSKSDTTYFDLYHSGQYSIFLYYLSYISNKKYNDSRSANLLYYLNKILHSVDWYYEIELPQVFGVEHPIGSVLGRAKYSNGFFIYQGCTVGGNNGNYPILGKNIILYSNASVLGKSVLGNNVIISSGTLIIDQDVPDNSIVFGNSPNLVIKKIDYDKMQLKMRHFWKQI